MCSFRAVVVLYLKYHSFKNSNHIFPSNEQANTRKTYSAFSAQNITERALDQQINYIRFVVRTPTGTQHQSENTTRLQEMFKLKRRVHHHTGRAAMRTCTARRSRIVSDPAPGFRATKHKFVRSLQAVEAHYNEQNKCIPAKDIITDSIDRCIQSEISSASGSATKHRNQHRIRKLQHNNIIEVYAREETPRMHAP